MWNFIQNIRFKNGKRIVAFRNMDISSMRLIQHTECAALDTRTLNNSKSIPFPDAICRQYIFFWFVLWPFSFDFFSVQVHLFWIHTADADCNALCHPYVQYHLSISIDNGLLQWEKKLFEISTKWMRNVPQKWTFSRLITYVW